MARKKGFSNNYKFTDSLLLNDATFFDYLDRFRRVALSRFEWVNLPKSMNAAFLEKALYYDGKASLLKSNKYGFINSRVIGSGKNIYDLTPFLRCWSYDFEENKLLYTGLPLTEEEKEDLKDYGDYPEAVLVQNDWESIPCSGAMELFALRLYEAERTCDINVKTNKFPLIIAVDEKQRLMMENLFNQYNGNQPFIFGDKKQMNPQNMKDSISAIKTEVPFIADKIIDYKKEIWNEALTFLGINNIMVDKKERLITDEANSNNELINLNLSSYLAPRQEACRQFNELFGLTGTDKEISVRVRSDLHNIIKNAMSSVSDLKKESEEIEEESKKLEDKAKEGVQNG